MFFPPLLKTFTYPDGSKASREPGDGEVFYIWDANQQPKSVWQWDGVTQQWHNITGITAAGADPSYGYSFSIDLPEGMEIDLDRLQQTVKCECGSEKIGSNQHSSWCPKHG